MDAFDYAIDAILGHKEGNLENAIYFINKNLQGLEFNYNVTKKEMLAVIYAFNKFKQIITGYQIFVHIDHATILYLMNKSSIT